MTGGLSFLGRSVMYRTDTDVMWGFSDVMGAFELKGASYVMGTSDVVNFIKVIVCIIPDSGLPLISKIYFFIIIFI